MKKQATAGPGRPVGSGAPSSDAVRRVRASLGITQEQLARELNCSLSAVRIMERQNRLPGQAALLAAFEKLAKRAGVDIEEQQAA